MQYASQEFKFNFKRRVTKDEAGNVIGTSKKQPSLVVALPVMTAEGVIQALTSGGKEAELVLSQINDVFYQAARAQFDDAIENFTDPDQEVNAGMLDFDKLDITFLANLPPSTRGASAITEDEWKFFFDDYLAVMVAATGKEEKRIANQIEHFKKPQRIRVNAKVLEVLLDQLAIYVTKTAALDDTGTCAERLIAKFTKWVADLATANDPDAI